MSNFIWVDREPHLADLVDHLATKDIIAVDTESDSLYSYYEKVCLVQISTDVEDYIIDPLAVDIIPLTVIFADAGIQKIFHAAEYDIMTLRRDYGFQVNNLFDTMLAARILGWPKYGLGNILEANFNVTLNKRFQQYNWGQRPLSQEALKYAHLDTCYLLTLRDIQLEEINQLNRLQEAKESFERVTHARATPKFFNPADSWHIRGAKDLSRKQQALLQALFVFRDRAARRADKPPFKIMSDATMVRITVQHPKTFSALKRIKGINAVFLRRYGHKILSLLQTSDLDPIIQPEYTAKPPEAVLQRYEHLRSWRNTTAKARGVEPDVILTNDTLMAIAKANPASHTELAAENILGPWQFQAYANTIIKQLRDL